MEAIADLDFDSPAVAATGSRDEEWLALWRDWDSGEYVLHRGSRGECIRAAKEAVKKERDRAEGDVLITKHGKGAGNFSYYIDFVDENWKAEVVVMTYNRNVDSDKEE